MKFLKSMLSNCSLLSSVKDMMNGTTLQNNRTASKGSLIKRMYNFITDSWIVPNTTFAKNNSPKYTPNEGKPIKVQAVTYFKTTQFEKPIKHLHLEWLVKVSFFHICSSTNLNFCVIVGILIPSISTSTWKSHLVKSLHLFKI